MAGSAAIGGAVTGFGVWSGDIGGFKQQLQQLEKGQTDLKADLKEQIDKVETDLKEQIDKVETDLKEQINKVEAQIDKFETGLKEEMNVIQIQLAGLSLLAAFVAGSFLRHPSQETAAPIHEKQGSGWGRCFGFGRSGD
eukprot:3024951-Rhodomonas_salina.3